MLKVVKKMWWVPSGPAYLVGPGGGGGGGGSDPSKVQGKLTQSGATSSTTIVLTLDATVSAGSLVVGALGFAGSYGSVSITDDKSNSYTIVSADNGSYSWLSFYRANIGNAPQVITATIDDVHAFKTLIATEFSNVLTTSPLDGFSLNASQTGTNTTNGITSTAATTTANGNLVWGACVNLSGSSTLTKSSTFTQDQTSNQDFNTEYLIQPTAGSIAATWTGTTSDTFSSVMMAFKRAP